MQPINIFNSQDVKVTIDENGTPVDVYLTAGLANSLLFYPTYSALPSPGQGGLFYITEDTNYIYRWDGAYIQVGGGSLTWGQITGTLSNQTDLQTALDDKVPYTGAIGNIDIGIYNVIANDGTSDSAFAPNFVGVENASGYTVIDPQGLYAVDGSGQMEVNAQGLIFPNGSIQTTAGISGVDWGDIAGSLVNQTDLQSALDGKVDENSPITGDSKTKITYDSKGLVTSGADAGISDITGLQTALDGKVPYTGATGNVDLGEYGLRGGYYQFDTTPTEYTQAVANLGWNDTEGTIETLLKGGNVVLEIGAKLVARVVNGTGGNVLKSNYQVVKVTGAQGQRLQVNLAQANNDANSADTLGLIAENISNNQAGFIITSGIIDEVNTTGNLQSETWTDGDPLYLSPTTAGKITNVKPQAPNHTVIIGFVVYAHANHGKIFVKIDNGYELDELHNVKINTPLNGQVLRYNGTLFVWENSNDSDNLTFNSPLSRSVNAISISQSSASSNGYLSSTDWSTFNSKEPALTKGNLTEATSSVLTISGGSSSVIGSGTSIQVKQASSTQSGYLSSTDWSTFNGKQNALTNPVTGTGTSNELAYFSGTSAISSLTTATYPSLTELSYLKGVTSSIQTQLNGKQATLTNPVTGTGTSGQVAYWNGTTSQTGSATFTFSPTAQLLVNNSITASSAIARGVNLTPTLTAAANSDVLVGLDINPTFTNGAFTGVKNISIRIGTTNPTIIGNVNAVVSNNGVVGFSTKNTSTGTSAQAGYYVENDVNSVGQLFKMGSLATTYKTILANDLGFYNQSAGDISILNDVGTGKIKLAAGGSSTVQATLFTTGNLAIATTTDSGYKLDVNGTARVQGNLTTNLTAGSIAFIGTGGLLSQSNSNLFWDNTNVRLGIGTSTPQAQFNINQIAGGIKGLFISGDEIYASGNGATNKGIRIALGVSRTNNRQLWMGDNDSFGSSTLSLFRYQTGVTGYAGLDAISGDGLTRLLTVIGTDTSNCGIGLDSTSPNSANYTAKLNVFTYNSSTSNLLIKKYGTSTGNFLELVNTSGTQLVTIPNTGNLLLGTTTDTASSILTLSSTTKGFLPPRMTGAQGEAISTPATGLMIYTTSAGSGAITSSGWWGYDGTTWVRLN